MANFRDRKLLDLAHLVTECQHCNRYTPGCEPAHANWGIYGKGAMIKAHDCYHAALCHDCHAELDQGNTMSKTEKMEMWCRAYIKTMLLYFTNGWIKVAA